MIRIAIVDDQALMRAGFRMILEAEEDMTVVGEAADGLEGVDLCRRERPDVVLMDIRMPDLDGVEATRRLAGPDVADPCRVLILTTFDLDEYVYGALRAGAVGFLLKDRPPEDLVAAVRVVAAGESMLAPSITRRLIEHFTAEGPVGQPPKGVDDLTERETEVLLLMARGLSNAEIAEELYLGETTVKTHVGHILTKLQARDRVQAVVTAYDAGLARPKR